ATSLTTHAQSAHLGPILTGYDNATDVITGGGYIRVVQDVRGKHGSEGDYVMNRPLHGPQNPTPVDHATDTYDTIDWLVKNIPESNGKVGILIVDVGHHLLAEGAVVEPIVAHPAVDHRVHRHRHFERRMGVDERHQRQESIVRDAKDADLPVALGDVFHEPIDRVVRVGRVIDRRRILRPVQRP